MNNDDLIKLQNHQSKILKAVIDICNRHKIIYYVFYGTLLGTIRHKGFIPWDNDIDIAMTRDEYNKFITVINELPKNLYLQTLETQGCDYTYEARISDKNTIQYGKNHNSIKGNISIDIFILDYAKKFTKLTVEKMRFLNMCSLNNFEKEYLYDIHRKNKLKLLYIKLSDLFSKKYNEKTVNSLTYKMVCSKTKTDFLLSAMYPSPIYSCKWFGDGKLMKFEDFEVRVPLDYDSILKADYGDYMKLPPKEKRFTDFMQNFVVEYLE